MQKKGFGLYLASDLLRILISTLEYSILQAYLLEFVALWHTPFDLEGNVAH